MDLSHNSIATICPEIGLLTALQRLSLSFNQLSASSLPHTLSFLTSLREIKLDSNLLDCVPLALLQTSLTCLSRISLQVLLSHACQCISVVMPIVPSQSNCICNVDAELCLLTALVSLSLEGNPLQFRCRRATCMQMLQQ
jgi:hypothetical protein